MFKKGITIIILASFFHAQISECLAQINSSKIKVAFVGINFDQVSTELQKDILRHINSMLHSETSLEVLKPEEINALVRKEELEKLFENFDLQAFKKVAEHLKVDHLFAGKISQQNQSDDRAIIIGELKRFDRNTELLHKFEILTYQDKLGVTLLKFKKEYIKTIASKQKKTKKHYNGLS